MVWIHGGGQISGEKAQLDASGLIKRSMDEGDGIIFVELNYRVSIKIPMEYEAPQTNLTLLKLGAFGWLAGDVKSDGIANAGLYDQRFALKWVSDNIHLFGGDRAQVTVIGESAGGSSIIHQITAYGGAKGPAPFQRVILQSAGWVPVITEKQQDDTMTQFLSLLGVTTIQDARKLSADKLIAANAYQVYYSVWGQFTYGPVVDYSFVLTFPWRLLLENKFDHDVKIMIGYNSHEGLLFTSPDSRNSSAFEDFVLAASPSIPVEIAEYIANFVYPPIYDGSYGYTDPVQRVALFVQEWALVCNDDYLRRAYHDKTYAYMFSIPPGLHGQDVPYTFYEQGSTLTSILFGIPVSNVTVALAMQDWFTSFAQQGEPESDLAPEFPQNGPHARLMDIQQNNFKIIHDPTDNSRCRFWQTVPYTE
jgi:carboxylesterase type B